MLTERAPESVDNRPLLAERTFGRDLVADSPSMRRLLGVVERVDPPLAAR
jgi:hypothetical protein